MTHISKYGDFTKKYLNDQGMLTTGEENHGLSAVFKFGHNDNINSSYSIVSESGLYRCPAPANATTLRVKAGGNANDIAGGDGARSIVLQGINQAGDVIAEVLALNGALASVSTSQRFMRLFRALIIESGIYTTDLLGGGQAATITIENTAGTEDWAAIRYNGFPDAQSQIGAFSIGTGQRCYLTSLTVFVDSNKVVDFLLVFRTNFMNETTAITPVRLGSELNGVGGAFSFNFPDPPRFFEYTDIALLAKVSSGSAKVSTSLSFVINENAPANQQ